MKLNRLALKDRNLFEKFVPESGHGHCAYSFAMLYIFKDLFEIFWAVIDGSLCVFFKDSIGCFLFLPPLCDAMDGNIIKKAFAVMDEYNVNPEVSRIENVREQDCRLYRDFGYDCVFKSHDFLCETNSLIGLRGNKFKSKRAAYNYFISHYDCEYLPFSGSYTDECLCLYAQWMQARLLKNNHAVYKGMMQDSFSCLKVLFDNYLFLGCEGRVVKINNEIKAFTFGIKVDQDTFCVLFEIADLSFKGLSQFIFRCFCREQKKFRYINMMDDSGLENLKRVKLSYHPEKRITAYIVQRRKKRQP